MRLGLQLTIRQTNVPQCGYPLTLNVSPMQAESFHGSHARAKTFLEVLAAFLQTPKSFLRHLQQRCKRQKVYRSTCSNAANARKFFEAFAAFLQTPKSFSRPLQRSCKRQKVFRGTCSVSANAIFLFWAFAEVLQAPISPFGSLQKFCKLHFSLLGICRSPASLLVWRKPKEGSGKNDRVLGDKCIGSNGFASAKKRQSVGIDEDGA